MKKKALIVFVGMLFILAAFAQYSSRAVRADRRERTCLLPGDELISQPVGSVTHAITIRRSPHDVWPWLARWDQAALDGTPTTSLTTGGTPAQNESCSSTKTLALAPYSPHSRERKTSSSSCGVNQTTTSFWYGEGQTAPICPRGPSCWKNRSRTVRVSSSAAALDLTTIPTVCHNG
jgi:hypothetical protein